MSLLDSILTKVENVLAAGSLALAAALAIMQVLLRTLFGEVVFWSEEAIIYLVIFSTFFGAVITLRHNEHVSVDILSTFLKERGRRVMTGVATVMSLVYFGVIGWYAWVLIFEPRSTLTTTPAMDLPLWVVTLPLPIGFTLLFLRSAGVLGRLLRGREPFPHAAGSLLEAEGGEPLADTGPDRPDTGRAGEAGEGEDR